MAECGHGRMWTARSTQGLGDGSAFSERSAFAARRCGGKRGAPVTDKRIAKLLAARFLFTDPVTAHGWDNKFESLRAYVRERKAALLPALDTPDCPGLGNWVQQQRRVYHRQQQEKNKPTVGGVASGPPLRFQWDDASGTMCSRRCASTSGNTATPKCRSVDALTGLPGLGMWVRSQRILRPGRTWGSWRRVASPRPTTASRRSRWHRRTRWASSGLARMYASRSGCGGTWRRSRRSLATPLSSETAARFQASRRGGSGW
jgi:hypothetical protein